VQRNARDRVIAANGESVRNLVETYGEAAVAALSRCSRDVAVKLGRFPAWETFPRPADLLRTIGQPNHGDDVATWALAHAKELADPDCFDAYLSDPLSYALSLKKLGDGATRVRDFRAALATAKADREVGEKVKLLLLGGGVLGVVWFVRHLKRQRGF
jgi:hypothetical protein